MQKNGWKIWVNAFKSEKAQKTSNENDIHTSYTRPALARWMITISQATSHHFLSLLLSKGGIFVNRICRMVVLPFYPIVSPCFSWRWVRSAIQQIDKNDISVLVSVNAPLDSIFTGYLIKLKRPNLIWIAYYIDGGSNYGVEQSFLYIKKILQKKAVKWENRKLAAADAIVVMDGHSKYYLSSLDSGNLSKLHIMNVPLFCRKKSIEHKQAAANKTIRWVYAGSIREGVYDPGKLFTWFGEYASTHKAELHIYGQTTMQSYLGKAANNKTIFYHGMLAHEEVQKELEKGDVLLFFRSAKSDSVSGKLFEYLSYGKPIVYFGPVDDINSRQLCKYPLGIALNCEAPLQRNTDRIDEFLYEVQNETVPDEILDEIYYLSSPKAMADLIDNIYRQSVYQKG